MAIQNAAHAVERLKEVHDWLSAKRAKVSLSEMDLRRIGAQVEKLGDLIEAALDEDDEVLLP